MKILVVEDDKVTRMVMEKHLRDWMYDVVSAGTGAEGWDRFLEHKDEIRLVLMDWVLPGGSGLDLCRRIKEISRDGFVYVIMCTGIDKAEGIITAMEAGADDYMVKPIRPSELKVRLMAARRLLELQRRLETNNRRLTEANRELREDLVIASRMQETLLPTCLPETRRVTFSRKFIPGHFVSGDVYDVFRLDDDHLGMYLVDVCGHGVKAAMASTVVHSTLSLDLRRTQILRAPIAGSNCRFRINPPHKVISELAHALPIYHQISFFTMFYGVLNLADGSFSYSSAGHPPALLLRKDGRYTWLRQGGVPVGISHDAKYESGTIRLEPGDAVFLYSDGVCEATDPLGEQFGQARMLEPLLEGCDLPPDQILDRLLEAARSFAGENLHQDDLTLLHFRYDG